MLGQYDLSHRLFNDLSKNNLKPDIITYNSMLYVIFSQQEFSNATKFMEQMIESGVKPNIQTFSTLISIFSNRFFDSMFFISLLF